MNRLSVAVLLATTAILLGLQFPAELPPRPPAPRVCDFVLLPQTDSGGCYSAGSPDCTGTGTGPPCCYHFHMPLNWNKAVHWFKTTGMTKGPKTKKYYQAIDSRCLDLECIPAGAVDDTLHYQMEDTLVVCTP